MPPPLPRGCAAWTFQELRPGEAYHSLVYDWPAHADTGSGTGTGIGVGWDPEDHEDAGAVVELSLHDFQGRNSARPYHATLPMRSSVEEDAPDPNAGLTQVERDMLNLRSYQNVIKPERAEGKPLVVRLWSRIIGETPCVPCLRPVAWVQVLAITLAIVSFTLNILTLSGVSIGAKQSVNLVVNGTALQCIES